MLVQLIQITTLLYQILPPLRHHHKCCTETRFDQWTTSISKPCKEFMVARSYRHLKTTRHSARRLQKSSARIHRKTTQHVRAASHARHVFCDNKYFVFSVEVCMCTREAIFYDRFKLNFALNAV